MSQLEPPLPGFWQASQALHDLTQIPITDVSPADERRFDRDARILDRFFNTPGYLVTNGTLHCPKS